MHLSLRSSDASFFRADATEFAISYFFLDSINSGCVSSNSATFATIIFDSLLKEIACLKINLSSSFS